MLFCCATDTRHADEQHERRPHRADDTEPHRPETDPTSEGEQRLHEHRERQRRQREAHRKNPYSVQRRAPAQVDPRGQRNRYCGHHGEEHWRR